MYLDKDHFLLTAGRQVVPVHFRYFERGRLSGFYLGTVQHPETAWESFWKPGEAVRKYGQ